MRIDLRRAGSRFETRTGWLVSRHSFSYGSHYDAAETGFGLLVAHNDDELAPGAGFDDHPHRGVEIVTYVVSGALRHTDDRGSDEIVRPGRVQRLSAGAGVRHREVNAAEGVTRYVQMWLAPDVDAPAAYAVADTAPGRGEFAVVASGSRPAPLRLRVTGATLLAANLAAGRSASVPGARFAHLFVVRGSVRLDAMPLGEGDAARVTDAAVLDVAAREDAEVLVWAMDAQTWRPPPHVP